VVRSDADERRQNDAFSDLTAMIFDPQTQPDGIAFLLDGLSFEPRTRLVRRLAGRAQCALYEKVDGFASVALVDLVPASCKDHEEVRHLGRNTLPAFRLFEKRFCRMPGEVASAPDCLAGYNDQTMAPITGPGYFLARNDVGRGEVLIDYGRLPESRPAAWPEIRSNQSGLARFVYGSMVDRLRRVSQHVTIGSALRNGRELGSYFVLSRMD
jgi:hypothetical protein